MNSVIKSVEKLRLHPGAFIDVNFRQGEKAFQSQLEALARRWSFKEKLVETQTLEAQVRICKNRVAEINEIIEPYQLQEDYVFFLEYYGGVTLEVKDKYRFEIIGIGPMFMDEYGGNHFGNVWDEPFEPLAPEIHGLNIGHLRLDIKLEDAKNRGVKTHILKLRNGSSYEYASSKWVEFRMDYSGRVQEHSIIALGPEETNNVHPLSAEENDKRKWRKLADSFSDWLDLASESDGLFGYQYFEDD